MKRALLPILFLAGCAGAPSSAGEPGADRVAGADATAAVERAPGAVWPDEGPRSWAPRPTGTAITANDLRTRLYQLADDSMMGRRVGEAGNVKATDYIAREFARLGLRPGGEGGTYFQELDFGRIALDSAALRLAVDGAASRVGTEWLPVGPSARLGIAPGAELSEVPTVYGGRWGDTTVALDPALIRGRVVVFRAPELPGGSTQPFIFRAGSGGFLGVRDTRALRAGAAAVLVAALDSVPANIVRAAFNPRMGMRPAAPAAASPGAASISAAAAARIFGAPLDQLSVGSAGRPVSGAWGYTFTRAEWPARNVIAILPGSDPARAGQYVLVGAHNDHVGTIATAVDHDSLRAYNRVIRPQGANDRPRTPTAEEQRRIDALIAAARAVRPPRRDSIMNGADDDGSGTVVLLELAERFARERPARSILFISHQAEEAGLLGSRWFVEHPTVPLDSIVAAFNMDMVGKGRVTDVRFGGPNSLQTLGSRRLSREFGDVIDSVNAVVKEPMAFDRSWDVPANPLNRFCRSDQVNYVNADIPVTYFSLGYSIDYHMPTDEPQYVDYEHSARLGRFLYEVMTALADRRDRPAISGQDPAYPSCR